MGLNRNRSSELPNTKRKVIRRGINFMCEISSIVLKSATCRRAPLKSGERPHFTHTSPTYQAGLINPTCSGMKHRGSSLIVKRQNTLIVRNTATQGICQRCSAGTNTKQGQTRTMILTLSTGLPFVNRLLLRKSTKDLTRRI